MVIIIASLTAIHVPLPVVVSVRLTIPDAISPAVGVYTAFRVFAFGLYIPEPPDHCPPVAIVIAPFSVTFALFPHTIWSEPAFAVGEGVKKIVIWSVTAIHDPLPVVVSVRVTLVAAISLSAGV